jgi:hypothetical protein
MKRAAIGLKCEHRPGTFVRGPRSHNATRARFSCGSGPRTRGAAEYRQDRDGVTPVRGDDNALSVEPRYVKNDFAGVRSAEHKPWIAFVRTTPVRFDRDARPNEQGFNAIEFRYLLTGPVARSRGRPRDRDNIRIHRVHARSSPALPTNNISSSLKEQYFVQDGIIKRQ